MFLAGHTNHQLVFMRMWQIQPSYLINAFRDFYTENQLNITRIMDVAQDLKVGAGFTCGSLYTDHILQILDAILDVRPFGFCLDAATIASRREYLNLDKWLAANALNHGADFMHAVLEFLENKMQNEKNARMSDPPRESTTVGLGAPIVAIFLRLLKQQ
jgi:CCR4-NOT transcription complex subunit 1